MAIATLSLSRLLGILGLTLALQLYFPPMFSFLLAVSFCFMSELRLRQASALASLAFLLFLAASYAGVHTEDLMQFFGIISIMLPNFPEFIALFGGLAMYLSLQRVEQNDQCMRRADGYCHSTLNQRNWMALEIIIYAFVFFFVLGTRYHMARNGQPSRWPLLALVGLLFLQALDISFLYGPRYYLPSILYLTVPDEAYCRGDNCYWQAYLLIFSVFIALKLLDEVLQMTAPRREGRGVCCGTVLWR